MAKAVFRPGELTELKNKVVLRSPETFELAHLFPPSTAEFLEENFNEAEVYTGPTMEDIRREAEEFKVQWEIEKETMISASRTEAERIVREAREKADRS